MRGGAETLEARGEEQLGFTAAHSSMRGGPETPTTQGAGKHTRTVTGTPSTVHDPAQRGACTPHLTAPGLQSVRTFTYGQSRQRRSAPLLNYLRRRSPTPPFPPDSRQAGERGAKKVTDTPPIYWRRKRNLGTVSVYVGIFYVRCLPPLYVYIR